MYRRRFVGVVTRLAVGLLIVGSGAAGCAAAVGAAMAAGEIRHGLAGLQQLISGTREQPQMEEATFTTVDAPVAGTYRGFQVLGGDTVHYYVRTARQPIAPIVDEEGAVTGYALHGLAAATLDTLEARVNALYALGSDRTAGRAIFFVEGTHPPSMTGRTLYPAAFLGEIARGESRIADRQRQRLRAQEIEVEAPEFIELENQAIPHELFGSVAEGIFTLRADGTALYEQEHELESGDTFVLHFQRISRTTLP